MTDGVDGLETITPHQIVFDSNNQERSPWFFWDENVRDPQASFSFSVF